MEKQINKLTDDYIEDMADLNVFVEELNNLTEEQFKRFFQNHRNEIDRILVVMKEEISDD